MDYSKCVIYKIVCNDINVTDVYVGHTTNFINRKKWHKKSCNNTKDKCYNLKLYQYIRENGGWDNFSMVIVEEYPCNNLEEARHKERYWYETLNAKLNVLCPIITEEEKREYKAQYRETHKEYFLEQKKQYRETHKEQIAEYMKEYMQNYNDINKEKLAEKRKIKYACECGSVLTIRKKTKHIKTLKHQRFLAENNITT